MSELVKPGFAQNEQWQARLAENEPGHKRVDEPLLILHSAADTSVPPVVSQLVFERMCGLGQQVERRVYETGKNHGDAVDDVMVDGLHWIEGLMTGTEPAIPTCP